jgi:drug/metabolite transporter superfamily protein YnfA
LVSTFLSAVFVIIAAFYFNFFLKWSEKIIYLGFGKLSLVFFKKLVDVQSEIAENLGSRNSTMPYII